MEDLKVRLQSFRVTAKKSWSEKIDEASRKH